MYQWTDGKLRNEGEVIYLFDANGLLVDFVRYNNHLPWPEGNSLLGKSIEIISTSLDNHFATSWRPSELVGGNPGEVLGASATGDVQNDLKLKVYPNPMSDELNILNHPGNGNLLLFDLYGRPLRSVPLYQSQIKMNVNDLPPGHYILQMRDGDKIVTRMVVKI